jgi:hypothetical protein
MPNNESGKFSFSFFFFTFGESESGQVCDAIIVSMPYQSNQLADLVRLRQQGALGRNLKSDNRPRQLILIPICNGRAKNSL